MKKGLSKGLVLLVVLLLVSQMVFSQGKTEKADAQVKIGVSIMELSAYTWYLGVIDGCKQWAEDHPEANFTFQFEDSRSDVSTMMNNIDALITGGAKAMILFPADASSAIPTIKQYVQKGIPFVIGDYAQNPKSESDIVWETFVGHDMRMLGETAGDVAVEYLKKLGKENPVCLFISRPTSGQVSVDRYEGFRDVILASFPKARIFEEGDVGAGSRDSSQSLMENVLQREPVIDVVSGHNDAEVVGAYNAAKAANRKEIRFIGIAGDKDVLGYVTNGNEMWLGEVLQNPVDLGYQATEAIYQSFILKKKLSKIWDLPKPEAITPANVAKYDWKNWSWL
jgi:ribose transport system substrate-binding protein